jgi:hypothetical protein
MGEQGDGDRQSRLKMRRRIIAEMSKTPPQMIP